MGTEPSANKQLAIFLIALALVLALGGWVGPTIGFDCDTGAALAWEPEW